jgi:hypothetical protein
MGNAVKGYAKDGSKWNKLYTDPVELTDFSWVMSGRNAAAKVIGYKGTVISCTFDGNNVTILSKFTVPNTFKKTAEDPKFITYCIGIIVPPTSDVYNIDYGLLTYLEGDNPPQPGKRTTSGSGGGYHYIKVESMYSPWTTVYFDLSYEFKLFQKKGPFYGFRFYWYIDLDKEKVALSPYNNALLSSTSSTPPHLYIVWHTDSLGSNLGEIVCIAQGQYLPCNRYPVKLVGKYSWFSVGGDNVSHFSLYPNLMPLMKGKPASTYFTKAEELNSTVLDINEFYASLLSFMSIRYYLGGLTSGNLTRKWLLQRNTEELYVNIRKSEFSPYLSLLTSTYKGYDQYMRI